MIIRENIEQYLQELRDWLEETKDVRLEEMAEFFHNRLDGYEEHMSPWAEAYCYMAKLVDEQLPEDGKVLDLGCGTGLELDELFWLRPEAKVTGIDLAASMLEKLHEKHGDKNLELICDDYFTQEFEQESFDLAVSVESLHHFKAEKKQELYQKLYTALRPGGVFLLADYIACCEEEESLLFSECARRRERDGIPEGQFIHFDTPLTLEHEKEILVKAGFEKVEEITCIEGATFIRAEKRT